MVCRWDCNIAMFTRTATVFPATYYDYVLEHDRPECSNIFALTGVPKNLFQHMRELCQLANDKEEARQACQRMDLSRVLELEHRIRMFATEEFDPKSVPDSEDIVHSWYDYSHAASAWKYGLLLYVARVLKGDLDLGASANEISSLSRLILDDVRCCRADSQIRKQLVHPVFLAGPESMDVYSRTFVMQYFSEWLQALGYSMFREAVELLQATWTQRDVGNSCAWWGDVTGDQGRVEYLLG